MFRALSRSLPAVLVLVLAVAGCDGGSDTGDDPSTASDTGSAEDGTSGDSGPMPDGDAGSPADGETSVDAGDTFQRPELDGGAVDLVHRPPECSISTDTCSLSVSPDMQTGLKAQVIRDGSGVQGETVVFEITSNSDLASIDPNEQVTDPMGRAGTSLNVGSDTGEFTVEVNVKFRDTDPIFFDVTIE